MNSNQSGVGTITATMGGSSALGGTATAIRIDSSANLDIPLGTGVSIINSGTISAQAATSDATVTTLQAFAIVDLSGKVNSIVNSGIISAAVTGGNTSSASVFAQAVNVASNITGGVNFQNTGAVIGDVYFGIGNDTLNVQGVPNVAASVIGNITFKRHDVRRHRRADDRQFRHGARQGDGDRRHQPRRHRQSGADG